MKGGKRPGAGRPPAPPTTPIMLRLTEAQRLKYLELGGARWIKRMIEECLMASRFDSDMVRQLVRKNMGAAGCNQKEYADINGYSEQYLSDFLAGRREPGKKILYSENLKAVTYYTTVIGD